MPSYPIISWNHMRKHKQTCLMFLVSCFSKSTDLWSLWFRRVKNGERFRRLKLWGVLLIKQFMKPQWLRQCVDYISLQRSCFFILYLNSHSSNSSSSTVTSCSFWNCCRLENIRRKERFIKGLWEEQKQTVGKKKKGGRKKKMHQYFLTSC